MSRSRTKYRPHPEGPARILRELRVMRTLMTKLSDAVGFHSPYYTRASEIMAGIDGLAELLTGDRKYFWGKSPGRTNAMAEVERKMEAGEIPWEWPDGRAAD